MKCVIQGKVSRKRRRGRPKTSHSSNITKWMSENMDRITRETQDRAGWRRLVRRAARTADHHSERRRLLVCGFMSQLLVVSRHSCEWSHVTAVSGLTSQL